MSKCIRKNVDIEMIKEAKQELLSVGKRLEEEANILSLLGSVVRLKIVYLLLKFESMCVCDLSDVLGMKQSPISQHLRKLKDAKLLENRREGMTIFYFVPENQKERLKRIYDAKVYARG